MFTSLVAFDLLFLRLQFFDPLLLFDDIKRQLFDLFNQQGIHSTQVDSVFDHFFF